MHKKELIGVSGDHSVCAMRHDACALTTLFFASCFLRKTNKRKQQQVTSALGYRATSRATASKGNGVNCSTLAIAMSVRSAYIYRRRASDRASGEKNNVRRREQEREKWKPKWATSSRYMRAMEHRPQLFWTFKDLAIKIDF